ncbi:MAG TPA: nuclear transport factor 2 family protein, partial [Blastocatellia bacterium]|nr:nuclear transport factor 2 family protein [Blastocatellia bacterium]
MRLRLSALILMVAWAGATPSTHAQGLRERDVRKELQAKYAKVVEAYRNRDIKAFMENKTPDFTAKSLNGRVATREQVESGVKQRMERIIRLNYLRIKIERLTVTGDEAVAITTQEFSRVVADGQGRERTVVSKGTTHRDRWVKAESRWMLKSVEELVQGK